MISIIAGPKGSGKTKAFIDKINKASGEASGNVICLAESNRLMYDLDKNIRLITTEDFNLANADVFRGFVCGIISQNYDITNVFIESLNKIMKDNKAEYEAFVKALGDVGKRFNVDFDITISSEISEIPESLKKYM